MATMRTLPRSDQLPYALYRAAQVREFDRIAVQDFGIPGVTLMERAGAAAFARLRERWPAVRDLAVVVGQGNNGGDGLVVARLARQAGLAVRVLQVGDPDRLRGDARTNLDRYLALGGEHRPLQRVPRETQLIVDGLFGTGLDRTVEGAWAEAIAAINAHPAPVLALDIPSGLHADTGCVLGDAVRAELTVSFIGLKQGLFTADGPDCCGRVVFEGHLHRGRRGGQNRRLRNREYWRPRAAVCRQARTALDQHLHPPGSASGDARPPPRRCRHEMGPRERGDDYGVLHAQGQPRRLAPRSWGNERLRPRMEEGTVTDAMTPEQCREHQRERATAVRAELHELRTQTVTDISAIRTAVQDIDRSVAQIKGYLGINGGMPHPHRRNSEDDTHLHKREEDTLGGWVVKHLLWLIITGLLLAALAGERIIPFLAGKR